MKQVSGKIELPHEEILKRYFKTYCDTDFFICHDQILADKSLEEIDATEVVNRYSTYINMFLGANCSDNENLDFNAVKWLFLSGKRYTKENLTKLHLDFNFEKVPSINLSNNDFGKYDYVWDFGKFLGQIYQNVYAYVYPYFGCELKEALEEDEEEFNVYGATHGEATEYILNQMKDIIIPIMTKLIPNVQNTNLRILINLKGLASKRIFQLLEDLLKRGNFDGCYLKLENCNPEFTEKYGLSENDFEFYQCSQSRKRIDN